MTNARAPPPFSQEQIRWLQAAFSTAPTAIPQPHSTPSLHTGDGPIIPATSVPIPTTAPSSLLLLEVVTELVVELVFQMAAELVLEML